MNEYHKIPTILKRDPETNYKTLIAGHFATPELEFLAENYWIATEKIDGTNIRIIYDPESEDPARRVEFRGRTDRADMPPLLLAKLHELFPLKLCEEIFTGPITLYGEGFGAKIQKGGGLYRDDQSFILFDVFAGGMWLNRESVRMLADDLKIDVAPVIDIMTLHDAIYWARRGGAESLVSQTPGHTMEGLVLRPLTELLDRRGDRIIAKIKVKDFGVTNE